MKTKIKHRKITKLIHQIGYSIQVAQLAQHYVHGRSLTDYFQGLTLPKFSAITRITYQFNRAIEEPTLPWRWRLKVQWAQIKMALSHWLFINNSRTLLLIVHNTEAATVKQYGRVLNLPTLDRFARGVLHDCQQKALQRKTLLAEKYQIADTVLTA